MAFANQLNMDIFVPALVFAALASQVLRHCAELRRCCWAAIVVVLGTGPAGLAGGAAAWAWRRNTFVPPMMFKNSGNMGLPLMVLAFGEDALPAAVVLFFVENFAALFAGHLDARPPRRGCGICGGCR